MAASTITRATWTDGAAGTVVNNAKKNSDIYDPIDQMFSGSGSYTTLTLGGALQIDGQPGASAYNSATQTLTTSVAAALTFDSEDFDVGTMHSTVSNTSRVTVPTGQGGLYLIIGGTSFAANATGYRELDLRKNGATFLATTAVASNATTIATAMQVSAVVVLAAADYVEVVATQTSGGNLAVGGAVRNTASFLVLQRLR